MKKINNFQQGKKLVNYLKNYKYFMPGRELELFASNCFFSFARIRFTKCMYVWMYVRNTTKQPSVNVKLHKCHDEEDDDDDE